MTTETKTPLQFVVSYETTTTYADESEWLTDLDNAYTLHARSGWHFADVLHRGISQLQKRRDKTDLYQLAHEQTRVSVKRMQNLVSMMNKPYAAQAQELNLEIAHVEAVLGVSDDEAEAILLDAAEQSLSANAIGGILRERRLGTVAAPNTFVPAVGNQSADTDDDDPPFAHTQRNVLYDDAAPAARTYTDDDTDSYTYTGAEFHSLLQRATHRLRDNAALWEEQRTINEWLSLVATQAY